MKKNEDDVIPRSDIFVPYHKDRKSNKTTYYIVICRKELNDWETRRTKLIFQIENDNVCFRYFLF